MRVLRGIVLNLVVLTANTAAAKPPVAPVEVSLHWLDALRRRDGTSLARLSAYPLRIRGINLDSGPQAVACGATMRSDGLEGVRPFEPRGPTAFELGDEQALRDSLDCLFMDGFLLDHIPPLERGKWDRDSFRGTTGTIRRIAPKQIARRLHRYRAEAQALSKTHAMVQARMTDDNGVTITVLMATRQGGKESDRVDAVFVDELFQE
jgi:hypothetical protein